MFRKKQPRPIDYKSLTDLELVDLAKETETGKLAVGVYGTAHAAEWDTFLPAFESVIASIAH